MANETKLNRPYFFIVLFLTLLFPVISVLIEWMINRNQTISLGLIGKWFIFWSVGMRLFIAGLRQAISPSFTAETIFHIQGKESHVIVRELGFANICFGLIGIISLFLPQWRIVSAFGSGVFFGIAGINHILKKPAGPNEAIALFSDIFIFLCLLVYVLFTFVQPVH
jgi:hypothetical protein